KMKKRDGIPQVELEATEDILEAVARQRLALSEVEGSKKKRPKVTVGFAAESQNLLANASEKLKSKDLDLIVANDISASDAGFEVETNRVTLLFENGKQESLPLMSKVEVAETIIARLAALLET
ncbi:MAG: bifunctional 4'-phosphopantothenoylcysteine decarboxylase/phosphopantothenoylcysteine synthetase, partial [Anaerolineae bacterium]